MREKMSRTIITDEKWRCQVLKVSITFSEEETQTAVDLLSIVRDFLPPTRFKKSDRYAPFNHFYLTTKKAGKP